AGARVPEGHEPEDIGANEAVEHLIAARVADDGDAVGAVGGNGVLEDDGDLEPADEVVVGVAVDEHAVGRVRQGQLPRRVHADDVFRDLDARGVAANVDAVAEVAGNHVGAKEVVAPGRGDEHTIQRVADGGVHEG